MYTNISLSLYLSLSIYIYIYSGLVEEAHSYREGALFWVCGPVSCGGDFHKRTAKNNLRTHGSLGNQEPRAVARNLTKTSGEAGLPWFGKFRPLSSMLTRDRAKQSSYFNLGDFHVPIVCSCPIESYSEGRHNNDAHTSSNDDHNDDSENNRKGG